MCQNSVAAGCVVRTRRCSSSAAGRVLSSLRGWRVRGSAVSPPHMRWREGVGWDSQGRRDQRPRFAAQESSVSRALQEPTTMAVVAMFTWPLTHKLVPCATACSWEGWRTVHQSPHITGPSEESASMANSWDQWQPRLGQGFGEDHDQNAGQSELALKECGPQDAPVVAVVNLAWTDIPALPPNHHLCVTHYKYNYRTEPSR